MLDLYWKYLSISGYVVDTIAKYLIFCLLRISTPMSALVAQSVEHHLGKVGVSGSNPPEGSW